VAGLLVAAPLLQSVHVAAVVAPLQAAGVMTGLLVAAPPLPPAVTPAEAAEVVEPPLPPVAPPVTPVEVVDVVAPPLPPVAVLAVPVV